MASAQFLSSASTEDLQLAKFSMETNAMVAQRFLDARGGDVDKALKLLRECVEMKTKHQALSIRERKPEDILRTDVEVLRHFYPHAVIGLDKKHRPILYEHTGGIDIHAVLHMTTLEHLQDFHIWNMEVGLDVLLTTASTAAGASPPAAKAFIITNMSGLTMGHCSSKLLDYLKGLITIDNVCYPETLGNMVTINTPKIALGAYKVLKGLVDKKTQSKIDLLGSGPDATRRLLEHIDEDILPVSLGGKGPEPFLRKPHTEFVTVPSKGMYQYMLQVASGHRLVIDSYIRESAMVVSVHVGTNQEEALLRECIVALPGGAPTRQMVTLAAAGEEREVTVRWSNPEKWSKRALVFSLNLVPEAESS